MKNLKITTHDGLFHADEVFAVAILEEAMQQQAEVTRTRNPQILETHKEDPEIWVLDVGLELAEEKRNFDHHQSNMEPATNMLILLEVKRMNLITKNLFKEITPFMAAISDWDVNQNDCHQKFDNFKLQAHELNGVNFQLISHVISGFNRNPMNHEEQTSQFRKAVNFAKEILQNEIHAANERIKAEEIWESRNEICNGKVITFDVFCAIWKDRAKNTDVTCAVMETGGKFGITSIDTSIFRLPSESEVKELMSDPSELIFVHANGFTAGFKTKQSAVEVAIKLNS